MTKIDFDNLMKVIVGRITIAAGNVASLEIDLELPRGFIAKFSAWEFQLRDFHEDLEGLGAGNELGVHMCILRDPDDAVTVQIPSNQVQHDAWDDFAFSNGIGAGTLSGYNVPNVKQYFAKESDDWITARNLRFNVQGVGPDAADLTESQCQWTGRYKLEEVTDADILNLLDIL